MLTDTLRRLLSTLLLCLLQVMLLSRIQLLGFATPLLYVYAVVKLPRRYPRGLSLLWGFATGLVVDMFANTPGVASATTTLTALLQPYLLELFLPRDAEDDMRVGTSTMGWAKFASFATLLVAIHCLVFFALEAFSLQLWQHVLQCMAGSLVFTLLLILVCEALGRPSATRDSASR